MHTSVVTRCVLFMIIVVTLAHTTHCQHDQRRSMSGPVSDSEAHTRTHRHTRSPKPGFFWTLGQLFYEQYKDTKNTYNKITELLSNQIADDPKPTKPTPPTTPAPNATTTEAPYRIERKELNRILLRNLRGIVRLYNLELAAALKQSELEQARFNKELRKNIAVQLA